MKTKRLCLLTAALLTAAIATFVSLEIVPQISTVDAALTTPNSYGGQISVSCPLTITVGVIAVPSGWTDFNRRSIPLESLTFTHNAKGAQITCDYGKGAYAIDRLVPGRVCTRSSFDTVICRAIPTKK